MDAKLPLRRQGAERDGGIGIRQRRRRRPIQRELEGGNLPIGMERIFRLRQEYEKVRRAGWRDIEELRILWVSSDDDVFILGADAAHGASLGLELPTLLFQCFHPPSEHRRLGKGDSARGVVVDADGEFASLGLALLSGWDHGSRSEFAGRDDAALVILRKERQGADDEAQRNQ